MKPEKITAEKIQCILLKDGRGAPVGVIVKNGHWVFYEVSEMNDDKIMELFDKPNSA